LWSSDVFHVELAEAHWVSSPLSVLIRPCPGPGRIDCYRPKPSASSRSQGFLSSTPTLASVDLSSEIEYGFRCYTFNPLIPDTSPSLGTKSPGTLLGFRSSVPQLGAGMCAIGCPIPHTKFGRQQCVCPVQSSRQLHESCPATAPWDQPAC
jgi:hypothetical protein